MRPKAKRIARDAAPDGGADAGHAPGSWKGRRATAAYGDAPLAYACTTPSRTCPRSRNTRERPPPTTVRSAGPPPGHGGEAAQVRAQVRPAGGGRGHSPWCTASFTPAARWARLPETRSRIWPRSPAMIPRRTGRATCRPRTATIWLSQTAATRQGGTGGADVPKPRADAGQPGSAANTAPAPTITAGRISGCVAAKACVLWAYFQAQDMPGADYRMVGAGPPCVSGPNATGQRAAGTVSETSRVMAPCGMPPPANIR